MPENNRPSLLETVPPRVARGAVAACFFLNGALLAAWISRIPAVQAGRGLNHAELGLLLLTLALGALLAMPLAGWAISRLGSRGVTCSMAIAFVVALPVVGLAPNVFTLAVVLFCFGATNGALEVAMNAQAVAVEVRYGRPIMSSFHAVWSFGGLAGAALGGFIASRGIAPFWHFLATALLLGVPLMIYALPRLMEGSEEQSGAISSGERRAGFSRPPRSLVALGVIAFCVMVGEGAMADWSAVFLRESAASEGVAAAGYAAFSLAMAFGRLSGDWLAARLGPVTLVRGGSALAMAGLALALVGGNQGLALLGFAAVGAGFSTIVPLVFSAAGRTAGIESAPALAMVTTIGYTGFLIGPPAIGLAAEAIGLRTALAIIIATTFLMLLLAGSVRGMQMEGSAK